MGDSGDEFRQQQQRQRQRQRQRQARRGEARRGRGAAAAAAAEAAAGSGAPPGPPSRPASPPPPAAAGGGGLPPGPPPQSPEGAPEGRRRQREQEQQEEEDEEEEGSVRVRCPSALGSLRRQLHANRCLEPLERPGAAPASEEQPLRGLKRSSGASSSEPSAKKKKQQQQQQQQRRRGTSGRDEDLLVALAMSRSLLEEEKARARHLRGELSRGKGSRAEKKCRLKAPRSPPPLLLQDPGKARREIEARTAALLLLPEVGELPSTPPLPASRLLEAQHSRGTPPRLPGSLWEFSSLTGGSLPGGPSDMGFSLLPPLPEQGFDVDTLFLRPEPAGLPGMGCMAPESESSQTCHPSDQSREVVGSQQGAEGTLRDLVELAGEGLTLTQWNLDVHHLEGPRQEGAALSSAPQKTPVCLQEEEEEEEERERESSGSSHPTFQLSKLATAFGMMVNNPHLSDVQFQVDSGEILYAHLFVLYARCPQLLEAVSQRRNSRGLMWCLSGRALLVDLLFLVVSCFADGVWLPWAGLCLGHGELPQSQSAEHELDPIDHRAFVVAEEGGAETLRMLLSNVPAEAVGAFLKYLYAADPCVPCHLQSDAAVEACVWHLCLYCFRFGVHDLVALCGSHLSFRVSGGPEDGDGVHGCDGMEDRAEIFEELLESMWLDEDEEAFVKCVHQEGNSSETVGEQELKEIYEFAATQRGSAARAWREEEKEKKGCSEVKKHQGRRWGAPHFASSREGLGDPAAAPGTTTGAEPPASPCSPDAGQEGGPQRFPLPLERGAEDRRGVWLRQPLRAPEEVSVQSCLAEGQRCSLEPNEFGSRASVEKPLLPGQKVFPEDSPCEPLVPAWPMRESVLAPSPHCGVGLPRSHLPPVPHPPTFMSGQTGRGCSSSSSFQAALEVPCGGPEETLFGVRPLPGGGPIVVLDSDEEWESGASVGGLLRRLGGSPCKSQELLRLSSSDEEDSGEGGKMLAPDTPLPNRPTSGCLPNPSASLMPEPKRQQWTGESRGGSSPERPSLRDQLPFAYGPLPTPLPGSSHRNSPPLFWDEVVAVHDSPEEQESQVKKGTLIWQNTMGMAEVGGAGSQPGSPPGPMNTEGGSPLAGGGCGPSSEGAAAAAECGERSWTGGTGDDSDGSDILPLTQRSPSSPVLPTQNTPDPAGQLKERLLPVTPLTPMPSYSVMATPELKKELKRFGVRALPKRQMVLKLKEIFQFTHQRRDGESKGRAAASSLAPLPCPVGTLWESQRMVSSRNQCGGSAQEAELCGFPSGLEQLKGTALPAAGFTLGSSTGSGGCLSSPLVSQASTESSLAGSETSVLSHSSPLSEFKTSVLAVEEEEDEEEEAALVPFGCDEGKMEAFRRYVHSTPALCRQILLYQPIELAVLQAALRQNGIRIALGKLLDFLDAHCITFTTAEARKEKLQRSQQDRKRRGQRHRC
ncbi:hypothetical protein JD844_020144 [Phrynosoma platyrhinos]|uniref:Structure-specific endonuclease subunit SLX4 n=1 Tax=Phrynosoma platyrhinos TaxID=52577 RepID=A0ABQ7TRU7_PHRPL|nr:hypothetical protein JD844_020144 [Phrynosoma platyrhinos]